MTVIGYDPFFPPEASKELDTKYDGSSKVSDNTTYITELFSSFPFLLIVVRHDGHRLRPLLPTGSLEEARH